nr:MAG TPA: hypothetical protein [Caudoviricetes sp.]
MGRVFFYIESIIKYVKRLALLLFCYRIYI